MHVSLCRCYLIARQLALQFLVCLQLSGPDYNSWDTLEESSGNDANMGSIVYANSPDSLVPQNASVNGVPCGTVFSTWYGA